MPIQPGCTAIFQCLPANWSGFSPLDLLTGCKPCRTINISLCEYLGYRARDSFSPWKSGCCGYPPWGLAAEAEEKEVEGLCVPSLQNEIKKAMDSDALSTDQHSSVLKAQGNFKPTIWSELTRIIFFQSWIYPFLTERSQIRMLILFCWLTDMRAPSSWHSLMRFMS